MKRLAILSLAASLLITSALSAETIVLTNGDTLSAVIKEVTPQGVIVQHPLLGQLIIPTENIESPKLSTGSITATALTKQLTKPQPTPEQKAEQKKQTLAREAAKADTEALLKETEEQFKPFRFTFLEDWEKSIQLGFNGNEGNSQTSNLNGGFKAKFENDDRRWDFDSAFFYGKADGKENKNQAFAQLTRDWKFTNSKLFIFAQTRYDYDTFQAFRHRIAPNTGLGYQIYDTDKFKLKTQIGSGFAYNFGDVDEKFVPEVTLGLNGSWNMNDNNTITGSTQFIPDVSDTLKDYRAISSLDWKIKMDTLTGLSLKFGLLHEYNTLTTDSNPKRSDLKYYGSLVYDF
ncbi:hypothetical protein KS4_04340 [Poriferisphaera corsica]|uniref:Salt-induced outer membrane protein n=1 Tax=Poriferisphaera corsica TaxID=2528020 RepID=A0A517YQA5_9BACT|nr:DUF481 domain-containing protein [Poriferisphaera corsica]QDU32402.1 hypothetical protein KS4_04340 [Poriferisphaera corsica]